MAKKSGAIIVPAGTSSTKAWHAPTWDKYMVPKPFSTCFMVFGKPIAVPKGANEEMLENIRIEFENEMHAMQAEAERLAAERLKHS